MLIRNMPGPARPTVAAGMLSPVNDRDKLLEKLRRIEALFSGGSTEGERAAAGEALGRIQARLRDLERSDPPIEFRFTMSNAWSRQLFVALLRRYGVRPYRYYRQRHTTVMARVSRSFVDATLWPELEALDTALTEHLSRVTEAIIAEAIAEDTSEAEEVLGALGPRPDKRKSRPKQASARSCGLMGADSTRRSLSM